MTQEEVFQVLLDALEAHERWDAHQFFSECPVCVRGAACAEAARLHRRAIDLRRPILRLHGRFIASCEE